MCGPAAVPIAMAVVTAATAAVTANQQKHTAERIGRMQQDQTNQAASAQMDDRLKQAREARAQARVASAEAGVSGISVDAQLNDILMQSNRDVSRIEKNRENGVVEAQMSQRARTAEINGQLVATGINAADSSTKLYGEAKRLAAERAERYGINTTPAPTH
jgi:hypothetical protein